MFFLFSGGSALLDQTLESKLINDLLQYHNPLALPTNDSSKAMTVEIGMLLKKVLSVVGT